MVEEERRQPRLRDRDSIGRSTIFKHNEWMQSCLDAWTDQEKGQSGKEGQTQTIRD